jgi:hypothetical protein
MFGAMGVWIALGSFLLFWALLGCQALGSIYGIPAASEAGTEAKRPSGSVAIDAALSAFLGLMLAFSFSSSADRLTTRRNLAVDEANAIGTAYLRLDLLPLSAQPAERALFKRYVANRVAFNGLLDTGRSLEANEEEAAEIQNAIWNGVITASEKDSPQSVRMLLLPAINVFIDLSATRSVANNLHMPGPLAGLMVAFALLSAFLAGRAHERLSGPMLLRSVLFSAIVASTFYTLADLDFPRAGLIRIDFSDQALLQLQRSMK